MKVIKSDWYHYDKDGVNVTLQNLQAHLVRSLNEAAKRENPWSMHVCIGKGDWKHRKDYLRLTRTYDRVASAELGGGAICHRCLGGTDPSKPWLDADEAFDNEADIQAAAETATSDIPFKSLSGWVIETEQADLLHCCWMGSGRDLAGSLCMEYVDHAPEMQKYITYDERLAALHRDVQAWCSSNGIRPSTVEDISPSSATIKVLCDPCTTALDEVVPHYSSIQV